MTNIGEIPLETEIKLSIETCPRCQFEHEEGLAFKPLSQPINHWTHWARCPESGEPVLAVICVEGME